MNMNQANHTSEIWFSATRPSNLNSPKFPDLLFSLVKCGSLDMFNTKENHNSPKRIDYDLVEEI